MRALFFLLPACFLAVVQGCSSDDGVTGHPSTSSDDAAAPASDASTSTDATTTDAAVTTLGCGGKSYKLCDDFDTSAAGTTPTGWTVLKGYGSTPPATVVSTAEYHSPPNALETSSSVSGASRVQKALSALGTTAGTHWGRIFFKVQSPAPHLTSQGPHATFVALEGNLRAGELRVVDTQQATTGKIQLLANTPDDQCCTGTDFSYTIYDGAWHCSEWYVDHTTQSYRYFLDSTEVTKLAFSYAPDAGKAGMPGAFTTIAVGAIFYTPTLPSPLVTWFDDLAIDDKQIGCR